MAVYKNSVPFGNIVTDGLVLNLDATNINSYPGSGTTWTDTSFYRNNGTLTNGPTFLRERGRGSIVFDGVDDNIQLGLASKFIFGDKITVDVWVKTNVVDTYKKIFTTIDSNSQTINGIYFSIGPSPYNTYFGVKTTTSLGATSTLNISTSQYTNLLGSYDGTNIYLYINGRLSAQQAQTGNIGTTGIARISGYDNNNETWNGNISAVKIYNKALSAQEVQQNFNALKSRFGL